MTMFIGDAAFVLEIALLSAGLLVLHRGIRDGAALVKSAGIIMITAGALTALCTSYYMFKYLEQGAFDYASPAAAIGVMHRSAGHMMPGMSRQGAYPAYDGGKGKAAHKGGMEGRARHMEMHDAGTMMDGKNMMGPGHDGGTMMDDGEMPMDSGMMNDAMTSGDNGTDQ